MKSKVIIYQECLQWFIDQLKQQRKFSNSILMQDGATPHTALTTREFNTSNFANRVIGKGFTNEWPAQSPNLKPADFYLWPTLKSMMYTSPEPFESVPSLKRAVTYNMKQLSRKNMGHLVDSVIARREWCIKVHG